VNFVLYTPDFQPDISSSSQKLSLPSRLIISNALPTSPRIKMTFELSPQYPRHHQHHFLHLLSPQKKYLGTLDDIASAEYRDQSPSPIPPQPQRTTTRKLQLTRPARWKAGNPVHRTACHNLSPWRYELHLEPRQYLPNPCHRHAKPPGSCPKEMLLPGMGQRRKGDSSRTKPVTTSRGRENGRTHDKPSSSRSSDRLNNRVQSQHHQ
jgi:hypothetical protein